MNTMTIINKKRQNMLTDHQLQEKAMTLIIITLVTIYNQNTKQTGYLYIIYSVFLQINRAKSIKYKV